MHKEEHIIHFLNDDGTVDWKMVFTPNNGNVHIVSGNGKDEVSIHVDMLERMLEIINGIRHV